MVPDWLTQVGPAASSAEEHPGAYLSFRLGPDTLRGVKDQETETREPVSK